jgi:hypothetical protein
MIASQPAVVTRGNLAVLNLDEPKQLPQIEIPVLSLRIVVHPD